MTTQPEPQERLCCGWCGKPISGPLWKRWCSNACKMHAYRERRDRKALRGVTSVTTNQVTNGGDHGRDQP